MKSVLDQQDSNAAARQALTATIERHVQQIRDRHGDLRSVYDRKRVAFLGGDMAALRRFTAEEDRLASELSKLERERQSILTIAGKAGVRVASLTALAKQLDLSESLQQKLAEASQQAASLQREGWSHLIVATRSARHYRELISIIAGGQGQPETYEATGGGEGDLSGGSLLDAAA